MTDVEHLRVEIEDDFIARQTRAEPVQALAELIWNCLDADATEVAVEFEFNDLGEGMSKIAIYDNGEGIPRTDAAILFGHLGGSWKRARRRTRTKNRVVHGQEGRGRYKAFALGRVVDWKVCYTSAGRPKAYTISVTENDLTDVAISEEEDAPGRSSGVIVEITELKRTFRTLNAPTGLQELAEIFAIYLTDYKDVRIVVGGNAIDPTEAIENKTAVSLEPIKAADGKEFPAELDIVEWKHDTKRTLYLCTSSGFPLTQVDTRFHVGPFYFSAYLKSDYVTELHNEERLGVAELDPILQIATEGARYKIKEYFRERSAARARSVVEDWIAEDIYPYKGEPTTSLERVERQVFDIVAVSVQEHTPDFQQVPQQTKALHLRMLKHAIERSPTELQKILEEVLRLPSKKQKELAQLLDETDLSAIISAATLVADRLKFLQGLNVILFDYETKGRLKERTQLHKILETNTWIFGEEFNLWASDKDLTNVLRAHREKLDPHLVVDEPVKLVYRTRGIVDLMLSRSQKRHRANDFEHLVIELKAPKVKLNASHVTQIEDYARAVAKDPRFHRVAGVRWHFWLISDEYDEYVEERIMGGPDPLRRLISKTATAAIGIKTWGEILDENRSRLQFVQEKLEHNADEGQALSYLQEKHREFLEGVIISESADEEAAQ